MKRRSSQTFTPSTSPASTNCGNSPECKCCAAIRQAREQALFDPLPELFSPLTPGVQLVNLSHSEDGQSLRVDLSADWGRMFSQLTLTGHGLVMTRNAAAILGRRMKYPALDVTSSAGQGANGGDGLWIDFRQLAAARALHLRRETGHVFGVEFADETGHIVHRFTPTPEGDLEEFFAWTRLHQACAAHQPATWSEEERAAPQEPPCALRHCDHGAILSVVAASQNRALPLRVTVRGAAATQRAEFTPLSLQQSDEWWFASDDETGLHFQPALFTGVTVEQQPPDTGEVRIVLRAAVGDGTAALILEAGCPAAEGAWRTLLETTA